MARLIRHCSICEWRGEKKIGVKALSVISVIMHETKVTFRPFFFPLGCLLG